jgi:hypothetical protein
LTGTQARTARNRVQPSHYLQRTSTLTQTTDPQIKARRSRRTEAISF